MTKRTKTYLAFGSKHVIYAFSSSFQRELLHTPSAEDSYLQRVPVGNGFIVSMCLCLSVSFGMVTHFDHIQVKLDQSQGHTLDIFVILPPGHWTSI